MIWLVVSVLFGGALGATGGGAGGSSETGYTRTYSGMGLGLSLSQSLIERMSGPFGFERKVNSGSRFWFEIPLGLAESDSVAKMDNADAPKSLTGCRILVAEDNLVNALVLVSMLERFGCKVVSVSNGQEAVDALKVEPFDAVLMDLQMPVLDGIAATAEVRHMSTDAANVPVIAITASTQESDRQACANVGMNDFICKPIDEDIVRLALTRWISA